MTEEVPEPGGVRPGRREALRLIGAGLAALAGARPAQALSRRWSATAILTRTIPSSGEAIPVIGVGTWQTFDVGAGAAERAPLQEVLRAFVALGGKVVDSSPMYGNSELVVGDLAAQLGLRPRLFVATKVWTSGKASGIDQMNDSMRKLRADPIDLMQVHNLVDAATHLDTLRGWKREGRVRYVGVTHYTASSYDAVADVMTGQPVDFIQINYSIGERDAERRLLPLARDRGVAVIANRPFAGGDLFRRLRARPLPDYAAEIGCTSWAQLMLKYILSHPAITCAIPGTSKAEHVRDNVAAGTGPLPDERLRAQIAAEVA
jgi:aryl-alcohol dehydrogenase-like predicted oxidoreductase